MDEIITVKDLIMKLLDCEMDWEIKIRDKEDIDQHKVKIIAIKPEGLCCLFG